MTGALDAIRVIDFGQCIAGPLAAVMLADEGADVIHVDRPTGPLWKSDAEVFLQRGKRRIALDLKTPSGQETARRLIDSADVVIQNFRPGVIDRLGMGAALATERNPRLIYCSVPGFAADDPRAELRAWEGSSTPPLTTASHALARSRPGGTGRARSTRPRRWPAISERSSAPRHRHGTDRPRAHWLRPASRGAHVRGDIHADRALGRVR
jgi:CoA-transferase family III